MGQEIIASAVDRFLGYDMAAVCGKRFNGVGDRGGTGRERQRGASAFQGGQALFEHILGGVCQPAVNVARIRKAEPVGSMFAVPEDIGSGLVNRYGPGIGSRIRLFLSNVELQCFEFVVAHFNILLSLYFIFIRCILFSDQPGYKKPGSFSSSRAKWLPQGLFQRCTQAQAFACRRSGHFSCPGDQHSTHRTRIPGLFRSEHASASFLFPVLPLKLRAILTPITYYVNRLYCITAVFWRITPRTLHAPGACGSPPGQTGSLLPPGRNSGAYGRGDRPGLLLPPCWSAASLRRAACP